MGAVGGHLHNKRAPRKKNPGDIETQQSLTRGRLLPGKRPALSQHGASIVRSA